MRILGSSTNFTRNKILEVFYFADNVYMTKWKSPSGVQTGNQFTHPILRQYPHLLYSKTPKFLLRHQALYVKIGGSALFSIKVWSTEIVTIFKVIYIYKLTPFSHGGRQKL